MRLTQRHRGAIANQMIHEMYGAEIKRLNDLKATLGDKLIDYILGEYKEAFDSLPKDIVGPPSDSISFHVDGCWMQVKLNILRRVPYCLDCRGNFKCTADYCKPAAEILAVAKMIEDVYTKRRGELNTIRAVLASATTTKQLLEIWPESEPFLPQEGKPAAPVPAIQLNEINELLRSK